MFTNRIQGFEVDDRLDARFYHPEFLLTQRTLTKFNAAKLGDLLMKVDCGPFGGNAIAEDLYETNGLPFIRPVNLSKNTFNSSDLVRVSRNRLIENGLKIYKGKNIFFGRVGSPCVSVYDGEVSISPNTIIGVENTSKSDIFYVYAFSASKYGLIQLNRHLKEGVQPTTSTHAVRNLLILKPDRLVQNYIGDKVRLAEKLRERSKELEQKGIQEFNDYFGSFKPIPFKKHYQTLASQLDNRIDTWFYNPRFLWAVQAIEDAQAKLTPLGEIATQITNGGTPRNARFGSKGIRWIRGKDFEYGDIENIDSLPLLDFASEQTIKRSRLKVGDIILSIKGTVGDVAVVDELLEGCNTNQDVAKIEIGNLEDAHFIASFFESEH